MVDESGTPSGEELTLQPAPSGLPTRRRALWGVLAVVAVAAGALAISSAGGDGPPRLPVALGASTGRDATAGASADMALAWVTYVAGEGLPALGGEAPAYRLAGTVDAARVQDLAAALGLEGEPTHQDGTWHLESDGGVLEVYEDAGGVWWYSSQQSSASGGGSVSSGSAGCNAGPGGDCAISETLTVGPATTIPEDVCGKDLAACVTTTVCPDGGCVEPVPPAGDPCPADATCTTAVACPPDADCPVPEPPVPTPPADLPSEDEARGIALDLLAATGMDVAGAKVTVDGPYDAWYVTVEPQLDGVPVSGIGATVGVGPKGAITSASGTLATPERVGDYPLIDTRAAIDRLNAMQGAGGVPVPMGARDDVATDSATRSAEAPMPTAPCAPDDPSCAALVAPTTTIVEQCKVQADGSEICEGSGQSSPGTECATILPDPAPVPSCPDPVPYPEPSPVEVTLTDATHVLVLLPSTDGKGAVYLVPGYRFSNAEGALVEVAAVDDESLAPTTTVPATDTTDTTAGDPGTTDTTDAPVPPSTGCDVQVEDDGSGTTHTIQRCPGEEPVPQTVEPSPSPDGASQG